MKGELNPSPSHSSPISPNLCRSNSTPHPPPPGCKLLHPWDKAERSPPRMLLKISICKDYGRAWGRALTST